MKRFLMIFFVVSMLFLTMLLSAQAQSEGYAITWFILSAGGGTSANGNYQLEGTAGQPEAAMATMRGGEFVLDGGFWGGETQNQQVFLPLITR